MVLNIVRWFLGYISFEIEGECAEKVINKFIKEKISVWNIKKIGKTFYGRVLEPDLKNFEKIVTDNNCIYKIRGEKGWPFFRNKYRKRIGFVIGVVSFLCVIYSFSFYIWSVKVYGNENLTKEEVLKTVKELGVYPGVSKKSINFPLIEQMAMIKLKDVAWMSINVSGSCVNISLKEKLKQPEFVTKGEPCNIVAKCDGQIEKIETYSGTACVNVSDVVTQGQLLISGIVENLNSENSFVCAEGKVFAKVRKNIIQKVEINQPRARDTGKVIKKYTIYIFDTKIPIGSHKNISDNYRLEEKENKVVIFGFELPIKVKSDVYNEQIYEEISLSEEEAYAELEKSMAAREEEELLGCEILEKKSEKYVEGEQAVMNNTYLYVENIGKKEKILFED
ncbi:MAG: sporulation protein YqfD [Acutalibacteraceae bacterium]